MKRMIFLLMVIGPLLAGKAPCQPPIPPPPQQSGKVDKADSLRNEGNLTAAIGEYRKNFLANPRSWKNAYNYACALSLDQQADSRLKYLNIAVSMDTTIRPLTDPDLFRVRNDKRWDDFENKLISMVRKKYSNNIKDIEYAKALWRLECSDQAYFYETGIAARKLGPDSPVVSALRKFQYIMNETNLKELERLLADKGWPKRSEVGSEAADAAFLIIQHSNAETQKKYLPMFEKACKEKEASWQRYALMFDRMRVNQNLPQRYGTHPRLDNRGTGVFELYPLEDETKVNEWRREVSLEPLKDYPSKPEINQPPKK